MVTHYLLIHSLSLMTDNSQDNIYMLKLKWDNELKWWYQNGTMDYWDVPKDSSLLDNSRLVYTRSLFGWGNKSSKDRNALLRGHH